jgi:hypothetical protein
MDRLHFLLAAACLGTFLQPISAIAQQSEWGGSCSDYLSYLITPSGECIDLSFMVSGYNAVRSRSVVPFRSAQFSRSQNLISQQNPFPGWITDPRLPTPSNYRFFDYLESRDGLGVVYEERYIYTSLRWPYTFGDLNESETEYLDCFTGWSYEFESELGGGIDITYWSPKPVGIDRIDGNSVIQFPFQSVEFNRKTCNDQGVRVGF